MFIAVFSLVLVSGVLAFNSTIFADEPSFDETHGLGCIPVDNPEDYPKVSPSRLPMAMLLPPSFCLSSDMPPVKSQGGQGSCTAWATSYYYKTYQEKQEHGWSVDVEEHQFSPSFIYNQINGGADRGSSIPGAMNLIRDTGDVSIEEFPYNQFDFLTMPDQRMCQNAYDFRSTGNARLWSPGEDLDLVKQWLYEGDACVISIPVYSNFDSVSGPDWFVGLPPGHPDPGDPRGWHALCVVGYDDNAGEGQGGLKIVNSWGTDWGDGGYCYLGYGFLQEYARNAWVMTDWIDDGVPYLGFISETFGSSGQTVTLEGFNFGDTQDDSTVTLGDIPLNVTNWSDSSIDAQIPEGAESGDLKISTPAGVSNSRSFIVGSGSFDNGGFETGGFEPWVGGGDMAGSPLVASDKTWNGSYSAKQGYMSGGCNPGTSSVYQPVSVPCEHPPTLQFWYYLESTNDYNGNLDSFSVNARDTSDKLLSCVFQTGARTGWRRVQVDLNDFLGQEIRLYFEVGQNCGGT